MELAAGVICEKRRQAPNRQATVLFEIEHKRVLFEKQHGVSSPICKARRDAARHQTGGSSWVVANAQYTAIPQRRFSPLSGVSDRTKAKVRQRAIEPGKQWVASVEGGLCLASRQTASQQARDHES